MIGAKIQLEGAGPLIALLKELEPKLRKKILRSAVTAAARPIRLAAKANAPSNMGNLKASIDLKTKTYRNSAVAIVGPRTDLAGTMTNLFGKQITAKPSKYAHLVEDGTKAHPIRIGKNQSVVWLHRGTRGTKFMQTAYEGQASNAMNILENKIREGLDSIV